MLVFAAEVEKQTAVRRACRTTGDRIHTLPKGTAVIVDYGLSKVITVIQYRSTGIEKPRVNGFDGYRIVWTGKGCFLTRKLVMQVLDQGGHIGIRMKHHVLIHL